MVAYGEQWRWDMCLQLGGGAANPDNQVCAATYLELHLTSNSDAKNSTWLAATAAHLDGEVADARSTQRWSWVDALFMAMAVWARLGAATGNQAYFDKMHTNFVHAALTPHPGGFGFWSAEDRLFYRDPPKGAPSGVFWSRGNGWAAAALVQAMQFSPPGDPHMQTYTSVFKQQMARLLALQGADGCWRSSLTDTGVRARGGMCVRLRPAVCTCCCRLRCSCLCVPPSDCVCLHRSCPAARPVLLACTAQHQRSTRCPRRRARRCSRTPWAMACAQGCWTAAPTRRPSAAPGSASRPCRCTPTAPWATASLSAGGPRPTGTRTARARSAWGTLRSQPRRSRSCCCEQQRVQCACSRASWPPHKQTAVSVRQPCAAAALPPLSVRACVGDNVTTHTEWTACNDDARVCEAV